MVQIKRKIMQGVIISDKMDKTRVVEVFRRAAHPEYNKVISLKNKFYAHDEKNQYKKGDVVEIIESRPLSRLKRWRILKKIGEREERYQESALPQPATPESALPQPPALASSPPASAPAN